MYKKGLGTINKEKTQEIECFALKEIFCQAIKLRYFVEYTVINRLRNFLLSRMFRSNFTEGRDGKQPRSAVQGAKSTVLLGLR